MKISRPSVDLARIHEVYEREQKGLADYVDAARRRPQALTLLISEALCLANCAAVVAPESDDILRSLKLAAQAHAALFAWASSSGGTVTVPLGDDGPVTYVNQESESSTVHVFRWLKGFYLAALCRDENALKILFDTPTDLLRSSSTGNPEYRHLLAESLGMWRRSENGVAQGFIATMDATDPERADVLDKSYTLLLDVPAIQCLLYALSEEKDFAPAIVRAAESHKKYWTSTKKRREDWDGFLSIPLLGIAALARDRGVAFDLDCDYVPGHLVRGDH